MLPLAALTGLCHDLELTPRLVERAIPVMIKEEMYSVRVEKFQKY